jgi:hypothetical protein
MPLAEITPAIRQGRCLCGQLRFHAKGPWSGLCFCHCESCRRFAGAPLVAWGSVPREQFRVSAGELAQVATSPGVARGYCPRCMASLTYARDDEPQTIDIALSALEDARGLAPRRHIWTEDKLEWMTLNDGLPVFPRLSEKGQ